MKLFNKFSIFLILILSSLFLTTLVHCEDRAVDESDEDVAIDEAVINNEEGPTAAETDEEEDEASVEEFSLSSPFVTTNALFIQPEKLDFPAGRMVKLLVGFHNNGTSDFLVDTIDASLRYPQDFSYHIQNFTAFGYSKTVEPEREATFEYAFTPSETFSSRPFGLVISLNYRNAEGKIFQNTLFNDTITIVEPDEGFDGETFFLYIFLVAIVVLLVVIVQQFFFKKRGSRPSTQTKTTNGVLGGKNKDIDFEWIPKEHFPTNKSPKNSPRQRKTAKSAGSASESEAQ